MANLIEENHGPSQRLKLARNSLNLGQNEFASKSGVGYSTLQKYEMGISKPGGEAIEGFVRLGINANWLLTGEGEMLLNAPVHIETKVQEEESPVSTSTNQSKKIGQKYVTDLQKCLMACQRLYGDDFNKMDAIIQNLYAEDLHENLQKYFRAFWPFYNTLKDCDLSLLGEDGVYNELQNLSKLSAVMKFPYDQNTEILKSI